jgi:hypothetical protein
MSAELDKLFAIEGLLRAPHGYYFTLRELSQRGVMIGGLTIEAVLEKLKAADWLSPNYGDWSNPTDGMVYKLIGVIINPGNKAIPDFTSEKFILGTEGSADGSVQIRAFTREERMAISLNTPMDLDILAAMLCCAYANGNFMRLLKASVEQDVVS